MSKITLNRSERVALKKSLLEAYEQYYGKSRGPQSLTAKLEKIASDTIQKDSNYGSISRSSLRSMLLDKGELGDYSEEFKSISTQILDNIIRFYTSQIYKEGNDELSDSFHPSDLKQSEANAVDFEKSLKSFTDKEGFNKIFTCVALIDSWNPKKNDQKSTILQDEIESEETKTTNFLEDFTFRLPITLIKKMYPDEWYTKEDTIITEGNRFGVEVINDSELGFCLCLNTFGRAKSDLISSFDDFYYRDILIYCDMSVKGEEKIFEKLLLKKRFFESVFCNFTFHLEYISSNDKFPSIEKGILFNRILALYFYTNPIVENIGKMRFYFDECIRLLKLTSNNERTSFFVEYAAIELNLGNPDKAAELYLYVIENYNRNNTTSRFGLAEILYTGDQRKEAISVLLSLVKIKEVEVPFYQIKDFIDLFIKRIGDHIKNGDVQKALLLQNFGRYFGAYLEVMGNLEFTKDFFSRLKEKTNNHLFTKGLIEYYLRHDLPEARKQLNELDTNENFREIDKVNLNIGYLVATGNFQSAIESGLKFINELNENVNLDSLYFRMGNIYFHNFQDYNSAMTWFQKISGNWIFYNITYLRTAIEVRDQKAFSRVESYLIYNPMSTAMKLITPYLNYCIKDKNFEKASLFIIGKLKNAKAHEYDNRFMSFLFQQQLRLTNNEWFVQSILEKALQYAINDLQKCMIHFKFGQNLLKQLFDNDNLNIDNTARIYSHKVHKALEHFKLANTYKSRMENFGIQEKLHFKIAECFYYLEEYDKALEMLNSLINQKHFVVTRLKLMIYIKLKNPTTLFNIYNEINDKKEKRILAFQMATSNLFYQKATISLFEESIKEYLGYERNLAYAIYLYNKGQEYLSRKILSKNGTSTVPKNIYQRFEFAIRNLKQSVEKKVILQIKRKVEKSLAEKKIDFELLREIDSLTKKHQFDSTLYVIKFNYMIEKGMFTPCEHLLRWLIELNFIDKEISLLFFKLAKNYYEMASLETDYFRRKSQFKRLKDAQNLIEYALHFYPYDFDFNRLRCFILYKLGDHELYIQTSKEFVKKLKSGPKDEFHSSMRDVKKITKIFIWEERFLDYDTRLNFYLIQEKRAMIFLSQNNIHDEVSIKILQSILDDSRFHLENEYMLHDRIKRRLGYYYYMKKKDYETALKFQLDIYERIDLFGNFVSAFLKTIFILKRFKLGKRIAEFYIEKAPSLYVYRLHGDFLRELNDWLPAYDSYIQSLSYSKDSILQSYSYRSILELYRRSIEANMPMFNTKEEMKNETINVYTTLQTLNPRYEKMDEALKSYRFVLEWCDK